MILRRALGIVVAYSIWVSPAYPWWETGHRTVARVAATRLSPAARARIARILSVPDSPEAVADALAQGSTWADETKTQTQTGEWHYIDLALQDHKSEMSTRCPSGNCASARIHLFATQLSSGVQDQRYSDLDALRYLVQPLHTISDADLGGNCERLDPPVDTAKNLHALWDGVLVNEINPDDRALSRDFAGQIDRLSASEVRRWSRGTVDDWVWESHQLAKRVIYRQLHIPVEPIEFPKAGLRLARLLNESL